MTFPSEIDVNLDNLKQRIFSFTRTYYMIFNIIHFLASILEQLKRQRHYKRIKNLKINFISNFIPVKIQKNK
ncbi:hypothetical protein BpHYR1_002201 [Brachionus plicatilis]|uniref:Uncharacterized protein n=1 Tax=Brachionus plicatilis TaxID=10195 RepID=A0A3M7R1N6_BRAPC|nr:hypothetical protein BpHYR1_002201 [Brachionus plicatilis]